MIKIENNTLAISMEYLNLSEGVEIAKLLENDNIKDKTIDNIKIHGSTISEEGGKVIAEFVANNLHIIEVDIIDSNGGDVIREALKINKMTLEGIITSPDSRNTTILHLAAQNGLDVTVTKILEKAPELIRVVATNGYTALHYAVSSDRITTAELLVSKISPELIKVKGTDGNTALHLAAERGMDTIVNKILEKVPELISEEVIASYNKCIANHINEYHAHTGKGDVLSYLKRYEEALEEYNKGIELCQYYSSYKFHIYSSKVNILLQLGRDEEVEQCYSECCNETQAAGYACAYLGGLDYC